ncbi:hypothetical protein HY622_04225 [Candidatus Uhrbacteria bacterium]|nr:hypothetical protein [Candidatus Uhrbacteria bacterium]
MLDPAIKRIIDEKILDLKKQKLSPVVFQARARLAVYEVAQKALSAIFLKISRADQNMKQSLLAIRNKRLARIEQRAISLIRDKLKA